jgi:transposase
MQLTIGIDVSKSSFDAALLRPGASPIRRKFSNKLSGFMELNDWVQEQSSTVPIVLAMEATGRYGDDLAGFAFQAGWTVYVVNPARIKAFGTALGQKNKTDRADCLTIALFAEKTQGLIPWAPLGTARAELRELVRERLHVQRILIGEERRLDTAREVVRKIIQERINLFTAQVKALNIQIKKVIAADKELSHAARLLQTLPGIGAWTAEVLLSELPPIDKRTKARDIASLFGLCPRIFESGSSVHRRGTVASGGRRLVRHQLYMPALVAMKHNVQIHRWAATLKERGKTGKQIVVAVIHRLMRLAVGVLKNQTEYQPNWRTA